MCKYIKYIDLPKIDLETKKMINMIFEIKSKNNPDVKYKFHLGEKDFFVDSDGTIIDKEITDYEIINDVHFEEKKSNMDQLIINF